MTTLRPTLHRPRIRPLAFAAASVAIVAVTYLAVALGPQRGPTTPTAPIAAHDEVVSQPAPALASGSEALLAALDHEIGLWAASLAANEGDYIAATRLGGLHLQRARITGDLGDYQRALDASERAVEADPIFWAGHTLRATVLFALHDFGGALEEAQTTFAADPTQLDALAVIGDASLELGDVPAAADAYAELADAAPSPPVWSRLAHLAFLRGDTRAALDGAERAVAAVEPAEDPAGAAFYRYQLGELHRSLGNLPDASAAFEDSLAALDGYVPAQAALANVREAQGRRTEAIGLLESAANARPQPEILAALGDLYALSGDEARAEEQYALVERIGTLARAGGGIYDRQLILFAADHGRERRRGRQRCRGIPRAAEGRLRIRRLRMGPARRGPRRRGIGGDGGGTRPRHPRPADRLPRGDDRGGIGAGCGGARASRTRGGRACRAPAAPGPARQ